MASSFSLPGLSLTTNADGATVASSSGSNGIPSAPVVTTPPRTFSIPASSEYRFESSTTSPLHVKLLSGTAELFGAELAPGRTYTFGGGDGSGLYGSGAGTNATSGGDADGSDSTDSARWASVKAAIHTWRGCEILVDGPVESEYVASETEMWSRMNFQCAIENMRGAARVAAAAATAAGSDSKNSIGPRILILGPPDSGKTSLAKTLISYAVRMDRRPIMVNLDPLQGMLSMPGSLSAAVFSSPTNIEEGWGTSLLTGPSALVPAKAPVVYHFGLQSPDESARLFRAQVTRLALSVMSKLEEDGRTRVTGCVIDTASGIASGKYELVHHIVSEFDVNVIITLGSERLYNDMMKKYPPSPTSETDGVTVMKLAKSEGCVSLTPNHHRLFALGQMRAYFFGSSPTAPLTPYSVPVEFSQVTLVRVTSSSSSSSAAGSALRSFLPGGHADDDHAMVDVPSAAGALYERAQPTGALVNSVVAVVRAQGGPGLRMEDVRDATVIGYLLVMAVDEAKQRVTVLAPSGGRVPAGVWVWGHWPGSDGVAK